MVFFQFMKSLIVMQIMWNDSLLDVDQQRCQFNY